MNLYRQISVYWRSRTHYIVVKSTCERVRRLEEHEGVDLYWNAHREVAGYNTIA